MPSPPPTWYFPTPDPNVVRACDWNPNTQQYDQNCRDISIDQVPQHVSDAITTEHNL